MKLVLLIWLLLSSSIAISQNTQRTTLSMSGSAKIHNGTYVSQSVGQQSVIGTFTNGATVVRQGFQQPLIRVVSLPQVQQGLKAVVYPNPMYASLNIQFQEQIDAMVTLRIFNISGQLVQTKTLEGIRKMMLDVSNLSSGNYILSIEAQGQSFTTKLIKN